MSDIIWFCQCDTIKPGGYCAKHGLVTETDRLRRRSSAEALERLRKVAADLGGWHELEKRIGQDDGVRALGGNDPCL